mmetsp:Transcript_25216/g.54876  ORF Transcript_25216/g.54876 Transcript_25216/m.54876 type:complete len:296 (-) Transcript_25216:193-1080(-)
MEDEIPTLVDSSAFRIVEEDEYDSEGFLIAPRGNQRLEDVGEDGSGEQGPCAVDAESSLKIYLQYKTITNPVIRAWRWKREHLSDSERFGQPYYYPSETSTGPEMLCIKQAPFSVEGFASTVWDSSIVMAKHIEKVAGAFKGKRCVELGAGCGLVGVVLARVGAEVTLTDLRQNLPLLQENVSGYPVDVQELTWGKPVEGLVKGTGGFDVVVGCDLMYIREAVPALCNTLVELSGPKTRILFAYGRNRFAEEEFLEAIAGVFSMQDLEESELDDIHRAEDVRVCLLQRLASSACS